jgi:hypothetical protein
MTSPTPTFREFLAAQAHRSDPIGDLAVCVVTDTGFPDDNDAMVDYITAGNADASLLFALSDARQDYEARHGVNDFA